MKKRYLVFDFSKVLTKTTTATTIKTKNFHDRDMNTVLNIQDTRGKGMTTKAKNV